ncbi:hypothetical protein CI238_03588, partial [Colletotrichum incanum]
LHLARLPCSPLPLPLPRPRPSAQSDPFVIKSQPFDSAFPPFLSPLSLLLGHFRRSRYNPIPPVQTHRSSTPNPQSRLRVNKFGPWIKSPDSSSPVSDFTQTRAPIFAPITHVRIRISTRTHAQSTPPKRTKRTRECRSRPPPPPPRATAAANQTKGTTPASRPNLQIQSTANRPARSPACWSDSREASPGLWKLEP